MKRKTLLIICTAGYLLFSLDFLFGRHLQGGWSGIERLAFLVSFGASLIYSMRHQLRFDAVTTAMNIQTIWWVFILLGVLDVKEFKYQIWSAGTLVVVIGAYFGFLSLRYVSDKDK